ncbi:arabinofuranosyltransferase [Rhodococcus sp. D2-41]|uniref:galactan 5-O-arabinofuranosyltransferase n=1 Tax=Speluncibacter jeojiensis TaxID=2710754 RepID=UPI00240EF4F3|nr:galactan 5-O-arabinofuranosyltransferase [Rhodococcus sp. D2-41]MDG3010426.1 arabinofuranosyltransferase [Rhodococcus sp. D2-41]
MCEGAEAATPEPPRPARAPAPLRTIGATVGEIIAAVVVTGAVAGLGLAVVDHTHLAAFNTSNVAQALTTVAQLVALAVVALAVVLLRRDPRSRWGKVVSWVGVSGFATATLAIPLSATKLYLMGVSVDQEFRTEFLTRMTDTASLHDMTYADLPSYYPAGWFWVGGRLANLFGIPGWEMFKPYAIGSLAVAIGVTVVLWSKLIRADRAVVIATATAAIVLAYGSPEAYGAIIAVLTPPALVLAWAGMRRCVPAVVESADHVRTLVAAPRGAGWAAVVGTGVFLGFSATFYTLYTASAGFTVVLMAVVAAVLSMRLHMNATGASLWQPATLRRVLPPLLRLAVITVIAGAIALIVWTPYLIASVHKPSEANTAFHYLPESGASLPLPMLNFSLMGGLCMLGLLWIVVRVRNSVRAQALGIGVAAIYLWSILSMAVTAIGTSLLGFRLEPVLLLLLGTAGTFCFLDVVAWLIRRVRDYRTPRIADQRARRVALAAVVVGAIGAVAFAQNIPQVLHGEISVAYTDTDGYGVRADRYPPGAASYFKDIDAAITRQVPTPRGDTVVLSTDFTFLAYYPYLGFQSITSHYANPLGQFSERTAEIERWSKATSADDLIHQLDSAPWRSPRAFVFRTGPDGYTLRLSSDVFPNDPNVKVFTVDFPEKLFDDPRFTVTDVGPFAVVVRK